jgi:hypothetical protein
MTHALARARVKSKPAAQCSPQLCESTAPRHLTARRPNVEPRSGGVFLVGEERSCDLREAACKRKCERERKPRARASARG